MSTVSPKRAISVETTHTDALCVVWHVSRSAVLAFAFPEFQGLSDQGGDFELRWSLNGAASTAIVVLADPDSAVSRPLGNGRCTIDSDAGLMHLEADVGIETLVATIRNGRVLYARTSLLGTLGLGGGRYEVDAATAPPAP